MNREIWLNLHFSLEQKPKFVCPTCEIGLLTITKNNIHHLERGPSIRAHNEGDWESYWIDYRFSALMVCNNPDCKDVISVSGRGSEVEYYADAPQGGGQELCRETYFLPEFFSPPLKIISFKNKGISININEYTVITELLDKSFSLFFVIPQLVQIESGM